MLLEHRIVHTVLRRYVRPLMVAAVVSALLLVGHAAWADDQQGSGERRHGGHKVQREPAVRLLKTVPIPGSDVNTTSSTPRRRRLSGRFP
jgi:hypothetical protein